MLLNQNDLVAMRLADATADACNMLARATRLRRAGNSALADVLERSARVTLERIKRAQTSIGHSRAPIADFAMSGCIDSFSTSDVQG